MINLSGHMPTLTIVMYHYVRPLKETAFPEIKGLDLDLFEGQLAYLSRNYTPVTMEHVIAVGRGEDHFPKNPVLLTFDDGYRDHHQYAFPLLEKYNIKGAFYPPTAAFLDHELLDVNRVHFILAAEPDTDKIVALLEAEIDAARLNADIPSRSSLRSQHFKPFGYDTAEVIYIKRLLQHALPENVRRTLAAKLFSAFVSVDEKDFANELYCSVAAMKEMSDAGHHIGSHGDRHCWLSRLSASEQRNDIERSLRLFTALNLDKKDFTFCYPYGDHNDQSLEILKSLGCAAALTTKVGLAQVGRERMLILPRLDTNNLPKEASAAANEWTEKSLNA